MTHDLLYAEWVLPGHPDKLGDRIADGLVDLALHHDPDALVGVEVAVHRDVVFVDGRIAAGGPPTAPEVAEVVRAAYAEAGYGEAWPPDPAALRVASDLAIDPLLPAERGFRVVSDDQCICVGYAVGGAETNFLPPAHWLAWRLARRLAGLRVERADLALGPDGKVLVVLEADGASLVVRTVNVSLQHGRETDLVALRRAVREAVLDEAGRAAALPALRCDAAACGLRLNGAGEFVVGGPQGDNGLSGKKLVVDAWGPGVPIGGGALSGKDPHKVDRAGTLRARQIARTLVAEGRGREALVRLVFLPGDTEPAHLAVRVDGLALDTAAVAGLRRRYDLSIGGTVRDLGLKGVAWARLAVWGHFTDPGLPWEGGPARSGARFQRAEGRQRAIAAEQLFAPRTRRSASRG